MKKTKIEWCDSTCNPVVGCTYGCEYCYAKRMNNRFHWIDDFSKPQFFPDRLEQLYSKKPKNIFMNSMSDIADWPSEAVKTTIKAINKNSQHNYLFLTKRPREISAEFTRWKIWIGTTITSDYDIYNLIDLHENKTVCKFISFEPLLGDLKEILSKGYAATMDWFIIGAETGNRKGKVVPQKEWIDGIVKYASYFKIPVFMKDSLIPIVGKENMIREFPLLLRKDN